MRMWPLPFLASVNKVNTKVDMRFDLGKAGWIPDEVKDAIRQLVSRAMSIVYNCAS